MLVPCQAALALSKLSSISATHLPRSLELPHGLVGEGGTHSYLGMGEGVLLQCVVYCSSVKLPMGCLGLALEGYIVCPCAGSRPAKAKVLTSIVFRSRNKGLEDGL